MLAAAHVNLQAGAFDATLGILGVAEAGAFDEVGRARLDLLKAEVAFAQNRGSDAPQLLLEAARKFESLDLRLPRHISRCLERRTVRRADWRGRGT